MILLWSNATFDDFEHPIEFLKRRISFLDSINISNYDYGYLDIFKGNLEIKIEKDEIYNETPYKLVVTIKGEEGEYTFPLVKFAIDKDIVYIYAIQNSEKVESKFTKRVNRALYKANAGFDENIDLPEIYGIDNLKDISVSFLVVLNIALIYFQNMGIKEVVAPSMLLPRWNAKNLAIKRRYKETQNDKYLELVKEQERIQHNLTEKFLRLFLRLKTHYSDMSVLYYPFEKDSNLHLDISNMKTCNNPLLNSINDILNNNDKKL